MQTPSEFGLERLREESEAQRRAAHEAAQEARSRALEVSIFGGVVTEKPLLRRVEELQAKLRADTAAARELAHGQNAIRGTKP